MENILKTAIPDAPFFPSVKFDYATGTCELVGESYMEDTYKFYTPLINWLNRYISEGKALTFTVKLTYFNTSSSRIILDILDILRQYQLASGKVEINWYYRASDPDMLEEVEDFQREDLISAFLTQGDCSRDLQGLKHPQAKNFQKSRTLHCPPAIRVF